MNLKRWDFIWALIFCVLACICALGAAVYLASGRWGFGILWSAYVLILIGLSVYAYLKSQRDV